MNLSPAIVKECNTSIETTHLPHQIVWFILLHIKELELVEYDTKSQYQSTINEFKTCNWSAINPFSKSNWKPINQKATKISENHVKINH